MAISSTTVDEYDTGLILPMSDKAQFKI